MIDELRATNVALIKEAQLAFDEGLTVITGETGSGKTSLLSALKLLVGERAGAQMLRQGATELTVEGRFFVTPHQGDGALPADADADEKNTPFDDDGTHVISRRQDARGRSRVTIDGSLATVKELASTLGATCDLCGQHEHQRLLEVSSHAELLYAFGGATLTAPLEAYRAALKEARAAERELKRVRELGATSAERVEQARFTYERIMAVNPLPGELEELERELPLLEHADALRAAAEEARYELAGDGGALDALYSALHALQTIPVQDQKLSRQAGIIESLTYEAEDAASELRAYRDSVDVDDQKLAAYEARLAELKGLMRTYGPGIDHVFEVRDEAAALVEAQESASELLAQAQSAVDAAWKKLASAADELIRAEREVAPKLAHAICQVMQRLEMGSARLLVEVRPLARAQWTTLGPATIELLYKPGAALAPQPLRRIASGGEISRVMLATKVVLGADDTVETLIFDEVDAGVGGATAVALAGVLKDLAKTHQVICVTHLPQVASVAARHYVVMRHEFEEGIPETRVYEIQGDQRVTEIARMLSGEASEASRAHARELLAKEAPHATRA